MNAAGLTILHWAPRFDHEGLASSLAQLGEVYHVKGQGAQAEHWLKIAIKKHKKGDMKGQIHHSSLANSLFFLGTLYWREGKLPQARDMLEQALEAAKRGDVYGRVDEECVAVVQKRLRDILEQLHPSPIKP